MCDPSAALGAPLRYGVGSGWPFALGPFVLEAVTGSPARLSSWLPTDGARVTLVSSGQPGQGPRVDLGHLFQAWWGAGGIQGSRHPLPASCHLATFSPAQVLSLLSGCSICRAAAPEPGEEAFLTFILSHRPCPPMASLGALGMQVGAQAHSTCPCFPVLCPILLSLL